MIVNRLYTVKHALVIPLILIVCSSLRGQQGVNLRFAKTITLNHEKFVHPPHWSGRAFIGIESPESPIPIVVLFDREGQEFSRLYIRIPGARMITTLGQARGADGTVAIVGAAIDNEGHGNPYVAILSPRGDTEQIVRTGSYYPVKVTIAPDGSIWTQGHNGSRKANPVFRRFDKNGKSIASYVPESSFQGIAAVSDPRNGFVSSADRVAFLSVPEHRYIEISLDGKVTDVTFTMGSSASSERPIGLALTQDGKIFVSTEEQVSGIENSFEYNFYLLDTKDGNLLPLPHKNPEFSYEVLQGVDSGSLVVMGGGRSAWYLIR